MGGQELQQLPGSSQGSTRRADRGITPESINRRYNNGASQPLPADEK
jgi:hypothetical protein